MTSSGFRKSSGSVPACSALQPLERSRQCRSVRSRACCCSDEEPAPSLTWMTSRPSLLLPVGKHRRSSPRTRRRILIVGMGRDDNEWPIRKRVTHWAGAEANLAAARTSRLSSPQILRVHRLSRAPMPRHRSAHGPGQAGEDRSQGLLRYALDLDSDA